MLPLNLPLNENNLLSCAALQAAAKPVGSKGLYVSSIKLYLNIYTMPCYLMIILCIINFILVLRYFSEDIDNSKKKFKQENKRLRKCKKLLVVIFSVVTLAYVLRRCK